MVWIVKINFELMKKNFKSSAFYNKKLVKLTKNLKKSLPTIKHRLKKIYANMTYIQTSFEPRSNFIFYKIFDN